jgi:predicted flap endonuclease-1-like 5' DNA nuclease
MSDEREHGNDRGVDPEAPEGDGDPEQDDFFLIASEEGLQGDAALLETDDRQAAEIREIFGTAFPQYLQPVEEILEQILAGKADEESFQALVGMLSSLESASLRMGFDNIHKALKQLNERVSALDQGTTAPVPRDKREAVLGDLLEIKDLAEQMAGDSRVSGAEKQKTIFSALKGKKGIGDLVLRRLSAAGIITVDQLGMGRPAEIAAVSGLDIEIVNNVLTVLKEDGLLKKLSTAPGVPDRPRASGAPRTLVRAAADTAGRAFAAPAGEQGRASIPIQLESRHEQVLEQLRLEVETEAAVEELRAQIRELRSGVLEQRRAISALENGMTEKKRSLASLQARLSDRASVAEELRARRDSLERECASSEEKLGQKEVRLELLKKERRSLAMQTDDLNREVSGLVDTLGQLRRSVAKGRAAE